MRGTISQTGERSSCLVGLVMIPIVDAIVVPPG